MLFQPEVARLHALLGRNEAPRATLVPRLFLFLGLLLCPTGLNRRKIREARGRLLAGKLAVACALPPDRRGRSPVRRQSSRGHPPGRPSNLS